MSVLPLTRRMSAWLGLTGLAVMTVSGCGGGGSSTSANTGINTGTGSSAGTYAASGITPFTNTSLASRSVCTPNAHQSGRATWTVLVYLNAASNLQPDSLINIAQMALVGSDTNLNIVVQWKQTTTTAKYFSSVDSSTGYDPQYANLGFAKAAPNWSAFLQSQRQ